MIASVSNVDLAGKTKLTAIAIYNRETGVTHNVFIHATHDADGAVRISQDVFSRLLTKLGIRSYIVW